MRAKKGTSRGRRRVRKPARQAHAKSITGNAFLALLSALRPDIDGRMLGLLDAKLDGAERYGRHVEEMIRALRSLCERGGKRVRPGLVAAGLRAADARASLELALDVGVALELLHAYFLIHDDWMDGDTVRRGGPAVHSLLARKFGSAEHGERAAILAGDYAAALALEALVRAEVSPRLLPSLITCFAQMQLDAITGQQLDVMGAHKVESTYILKTSSYTVRGPLQLGALMGGASSRLLAALDRYALPVGIAFQLRDDLLGIFGDPAHTGKPFGSDLKSGKRTALLMSALRRSKGKTRAAIERVVGNARASDRALRAAIDAISATGAPALIEARIEQLVAQGLEALKTGPVTQQGRELLYGAAEALARRQS